MTIEETKTLQELELDRGELVVTRTRLCAEKTALQSQVAELNSKCATRLNQSLFASIQRRRSELVSRVNEKEQEIQEINAQIQITQSAADAKRHTVEVKRFEVRQLVHLRDQWHEFSMDPKNHQKAREAAWKFSQELREILKRHFESKNGEQP